MREQDLRKAFGLHLRALRKARGITQDALAEQVGLTNDAVSKIERGISFTGLGTLLKLGNSLQVTLPHLFAWAPLKYGSPKQVEQELLIEKFRHLLTSDTPATLDDAAELLRALTEKRPKQKH